MLNDIADLERSALAAIEAAKNLQDLENLRIKFLSRKGEVSALFERLKSVPEHDRPSVGRALNGLRGAIQSAYENRRSSMEGEEQRVSAAVDLSLPGRAPWPGSKHPITQTLDEVKRIFISMGFDLATGPEIEDDYHNFEALNFPADHPARDMQDTFFLSDKVLLRTHTSPVQIRVMERQKPPVRVIVPGRVYRNEAVSARSYCLFHQVEGLYVDVGVTFSELKGTLVAFAGRMFGSETRYRFRPSYFPFTEPSAEMDISCFICSGKGCKVCKKTGWLEILGCGMVNPHVYEFVGYDPEKYTGYAFGIGIERMAMLRHGIDDIRLFFDNHVQFLKQF